MTTFWEAWTLRVIVTTSKECLRVSTYSLIVTPIVLLWLELESGLG